MTAYSFGVDGKGWNALERSKARLSMIAAFFAAPFLVVTVATLMMVCAWCGWSAASTWLSYLGQLWK